MHNLRQGYAREQMMINMQQNQQTTWIDIIVILVLAVLCCSRFKSQLRADDVFKGIKRK